MTQDTPPKTGWNTIDKVNVTYVFGYRKAYSGVWGFDGSRHTCADSAAALSERSQSPPLNQSQVAAMIKPCPSSILSAIGKNASGPVVHIRHRVRCIGALSTAPATEVLLASCLTPVFGMGTYTSHLSFTSSRVCQSRVVPMLLSSCLS